MLECTKLKIQPQGQGTGCGRRDVWRTPKMCQPNGLEWMKAATLRNVQAANQQGQGKSRNCVFSNSHAKQPRPSCLPGSLSQAMKSQKKKKIRKGKKTPWQWVLQFSRYRSTRWHTSPHLVLVSSYHPGIPVARSTVSSVLKLFHIFAVFENVDDFMETFPPLLGFSFLLSRFLVTPS